MARTIARAIERNRQPRKLHGRGKQRPQARHKGRSTKKSKRTLKTKQKHAAKKARGR